MTGCIYYNAPYVGAYLHVIENYYNTNHNRIFAARPATHGHLCERSILEKKKNQKTIILLTEVWINKLMEPDQTRTMILKIWFNIFRTR